jgi:hypothetical protein
MQVTGNVGVGGCLHSAEDEDASFCKRLATTLMFPYTLHQHEGRTGKRRAPRSTHNIGPRRIHTFTAFFLLRPLHYVLI